MSVSSPTIPTARNAVRHRIRDGVPTLDATPVPFQMVRLENLGDQIVTPPPATPIQTVFQVRYDNVPTQNYINVSAVPNTLVAYVDGSWSPTIPIKDVDVNGNFTLPVPPLQQLFITYAWQYFADGEIDQFVDEARQWLREFTDVTLIPDGLVPALISYASARCLYSLSRSATLAPIRAGNSDVDWSKLGIQYLSLAQSEEKTAKCEREAYYTQGPEALDPTAVGISAPSIGPYTPIR